jgi:hypothetical protein
MPDLAGTLSQIAQPPATIGSLNLTPQENYLYQMHLKNLLGPGGVTNFNGSRSTLRQMSTNIGDRVYNLPTVWGGRILPPDQAVQQAQQAGIQNFPSYATSDEAEARYQQMHEFLDQDVQRAKTLPMPLGSWGNGQ